MNSHRRTFAAIIASLGMSRWAHAQQRAAPQDAGKQLRRMILGTKATDLGLAPSAQFPRVFGAVMDWPLGDQIATVVALSDGTASLYTTSTFGIIGGQAHESVRAAGKLFLAAAESYHGEAEPTSSYPYPSRDQVTFYLLCYDGVRVVRGDLAQTQAGTSRQAALFSAAQGMLTELRRSVGK